MTEILRVALLPCVDMDQVSWGGPDRHPPRPELQAHPMAS